MILYMLAFWKNKYIHESLSFDTLFSDSSLQCEDQEEVVRKHIPNPHNLTEIQKIWEGR